MNLNEPFMNPADYTHPQAQKQLSRWRVPAVQTDSHPDTVTLSPLHGIWQGRESCPASFSIGWRRLLRRKRWVLRINNTSSAKSSRLQFRKKVYDQMNSTYVVDLEHTCGPQTWVCVANGNKISLPQLVSEGLIVLWLLYYCQSSRYLASLNSFEWCVDSENKPGEQRPGGIQGSDCTSSSPPCGSGYSDLGGKMDGHTKSLEVCQCASVRLRFL